MIALLQRVSRARVEVSGQSIAKIGQGILVFIGVEPADTEKTADLFASRLLNYRIFADQQGKTNLSLLDIQGGLLLVPQFTLVANTSKGRRPSFTTAADPEQGKVIFQTMLRMAQARYERVESGQFGADMQVHLVNDGPVTFILN